jgi:hypothetical protein
VLERVRAARVAQRPDSLGRGPAVLVDLDPPVLAQPDAGPVQVQVRRVRLAAGRDQQQLAGDRRLALDLDLDLAAARRPRWPGSSGTTRLPEPEPMTTSEK